MRITFGIFLTFGAIKHRNFLQHFVFRGDHPSKYCPVTGDEMRSAVKLITSSGKLFGGDSFCMEKYFRKRIGKKWYLHLRRC